MKYAAALRCAARPPSGRRRRNAIWIMEYGNTIRYMYMLYVYVYVYMNCLYVYVYAI